MLTTWTPSDFPVGFLDLHTDPGINFLLNRIWILSNDDELSESLQAGAPSIHDFEDLARELGQLAIRAEADGQPLRAALCYRGAEFHLPESDPRKHQYRQRFCDLSRKFYGVTEDHQFRVRFDDVELVGYRFAHEQPRGCALFINGFDGCWEELFRLLLCFWSEGYEVIAFDGPGQGHVLQETGIPLTPHWEGPVGALLDHLQLTDVTAIGCSMGGALVVHAAAHEPRISRVICFDVLPDFFDCALRRFPAPVQAALRAGINSPLLEKPVDAAIRTAVHRGSNTAWGLQQGLLVTGTNSPSKFLQAAQLFLTDAVSPQVRQDVLLMAGADDHYVPDSHLVRQMSTLTGARSISTRTFTAEESAQSHCQLGNLGLAITTMLAWLDSMAHRRLALPTAQGRTGIGHSHE